MTDFSGHVFDRGIATRLISMSVQPLRIRWISGGVIPNENLGELSKVTTCDHRSGDMTTNEINRAIKVLSRIEQDECIRGRASARHRAVRPTCRAPARETHVVCTFPAASTFAETRER